MYEKPTLERFGTFRELTRAGNRVGGGDLTIVFYSGSISGGDGGGNGNPSPIEENNPSTS